MNFGKINFREYRIWGIFKHPVLYCLLLSLQNFQKNYFMKEKIIYIFLFYSRGPFDTWPQFKVVDPRKLDLRQK